MRIALIAAALLLGAAPAAVAQEPVGSLLNNPDAASLNLYGAKQSVIDDPAVPGGKALRVEVAAKGANPWDASVSSPLRSPVKAGDPLVLSFWARLAAGENGATSTTLPWNAISLASPPWTALFGQGVTIGPEWKRYEVRGTADKDYAAGTLQAGIQVATAQQTLDFGPVSVSKASGAPAAAAVAPAPARPKPTGLASLDPAKIAGMIINDSGAPQVIKAKAKLVDDERVSGGKALRVQIAGKGQNPWDSSVSTKVNKPVKAGDKLLLVFWARLEQGENGATAATLPWNSVNMTSPPWSGVLGGPAEIGLEWKMFEFTTTADKDYSPDSIRVSMQLATAKQTVDLGPIILLNLGP